MPADKAAGSTAFLIPASIANRQAADASRLRLVIGFGPDGVRVESAEVEVG